MVDSRSTSIVSMMTSLTLQSRVRSVRRHRANLRSHHFLFYFHTATDDTKMRIHRCFLIVLLALDLLLDVSGWLPSASNRPSRSFNAQQSTNDEAIESAATLRSVTFSNLQKSHEPQLLCNFLMELGAASTSITDADSGTENETPLFDEFDTASMTRTAVTTHVWDHCNVTAFFPQSTSLEWIMEIVQDIFPDLPKYDQVANVEDKDWVLHVQQGCDGERHEEQVGN